MGDMLSQEEIDALLKGTSPEPEEQESVKEDLSEDEKDALGEIGNISMGTSATTLFTLLGQKVTITTPKVSILTMDELAKQYPLPFVVVEVKYKEGIEGTNLLVLQEDDVKVITDLMMGGAGTNATGELTELHLSAIGEAMNQMVGSASTSLSEMFNSKIDIHPPKAVAINFSTGPEDFGSITHSDVIVKVAFRMVVGDIIDSEIMQIIPIDFAKELVHNLLSGASTNLENYEPNDTNHVNEQNLSATSASPQYNMPTQEPEIGYHYNQAPQQTNMHRREPVNVQPAQFPSFDEGFSSAEKENISLIRDVPLEITVELGRTSRKISEILSFAQGTVIELDKLVGEPLDILVNGQFMAKGEVVVIDENYGVRITDMVHPTKRLNKLK